MAERKKGIKMTERMKGMKMAERKKVFKMAKDDFSSSWKSDWDEEFSEVMNDTIEDISDEIADEMMELITWDEEYPESPVWDPEADDGPKQIINLDKIEDEPEPVETPTNLDEIEIVEESEESDNVEELDENEQLEESEKQLKMEQMKFTRCMYGKPKLFKNLARCITGKKKSKKGKEKEE